MFRHDPLGYGHGVSSPPASTQCGASCGSDARYKHGTTAEIVHGRSKDEGFIDGSLVAGSGTSCGTDRRLALPSAIHTEQEEGPRLK